MSLTLLRLSDVLRMALAGENVRVPCTAGMAKFYRKAIEEYVLKNTTEPIAIIIAPDSSFITIKKYPQPLPIEDLNK